MTGSRSGAFHGGQPLRETSSADRLSQWRHRNTCRALARVSRVLPSVIPKCAIETDRGAKLAVRKILPIGIDEYLTKAKRPHNSRLD